MGERKVLNKYFPPDWDPSLLPRTSKPKNNQQTVRLMLPMSMQCLSCGDYLHAGKKFNGRKEEAKGENYLGIKLYRFYFKCSTCLAEITFKTDPKNHDYTVERGAARNFEPWKQSAKEERIEKEKREKEEKGDAMKALENRSAQSARDLAIADAIDEVLELNARAAAVDVDELQMQARQQEQQLEDEQIEAMAAAAFAGKKAAAAAGAVTKTLPDPPSLDDDDDALPVVKRLPDPKDLTADDEQPNGNPSSSAAAAASSSSLSSLPVAAAASESSSPFLPSSGLGFSAAPLAGVVRLKKRNKDESDADKAARRKEKRARKEAKAAAAAAAPPSEEASSNGLGGLLGNYDDSD